MVCCVKKELFDGTFKCFSRHGQCKFTQARNIQGQLWNHRPLGLLFHAVDSSIQSFRKKCSRTFFLPEAIKELLIFT